MPGYITAALDKFKHKTPAQPQHAPHAWVKPTYGTNPQLPFPEDVSAPL
jgi:hypothetical protein